MPKATTRPVARTPCDVAGEIREFLRSRNYPELVVLPPAVGSSIVELRGTFPLRDPSGFEFDRFQIRIEVRLPLYHHLPQAWELAGRIPRTVDRHVNETDDTLCTCFPDEWWFLPPEKRSFQHYIDVYLYNYFLWQISFERGEKSPFGARRHGLEGCFESYAEFLGVDPGARKSIVRHLFYLTHEKIRGHWKCPCGSGEILRYCHVGSIRGLQQRLPVEVANDCLRRLRSEQERKPFLTPADWREALQHPL